MLMLETWPFWAIGLLFAAAALVVLVCGVRLTHLADRVADVTGIGEAVTGAVFLGALTSLSGSVTSVTAAYGGHAELAVGNGVGGIAAQTAFLVVADWVYRRANLEHAAASLPNMVNCVALMALMALVLMAAVLPPIAVWGIHPMTPVLFVAYAVSVRLAAHTTTAPSWLPQRTAETREDVPAEPRGDHQTVLSMLSILLLFGVVIGVAGWVIAETGLEIAMRTGIREGVIGALMTSIVTSTPELVTVIAAVRRQALTLAVGGIVGGNTFDVLFVAFSDMAYREGSIYHAMGDGQVFLILVSMVMSATLLLGLLRRERYGPGNIGVESVMLLAIYMAGVVIFSVAY